MLCALFSTFWYVTICDLLIFFFCSVPATTTPRHNCCWFSSLISYGLHLGPPGKEGKTQLKVKMYAFFLNSPQNVIICTVPQLTKWLEGARSLLQNKALFTTLFVMHKNDIEDTEDIVKCKIVLICLIRMESLSIIIQVLFVLIFKAQSEDVTWRPAVPHTLKDQIE